MLASKNRLFQWYYEITEETLEAIQDMEMGTIEECLTKREQLIEQVDEIDRNAGEILLNDDIRDWIIKIKELDERLIMKLNELKTESTQKLLEIKAGKQLQNKYQEGNSFVDSVFYDNRK